jgi:hypothetical protein
LTDQEMIYQQWVPVVGRSLAYLCLNAGDLRDKNLAEKAAFLEALGIERKEAAGMLGTTYASITQTLSRVKRIKKGGRKSGRKTKGRKTRQQTS